MRLSMARLRTPLAGIAGGLLLLAVSGCGETQTFANKSRQPTVLNVTAAITPTGVELSPDKIGAGPIHLVVTNQSDASRDLSVESQSTDAGEKPVSSGPINPQGTAEVNVNLEQGDYKVGASGTRGAKLTVGPSRPSGQNEVLEP
jgi:hypothetical protein